MNNEKVRSSLLGTKDDIYPMVMQYFLLDVFLETKVQPIEREEVVVTLLGNVPIPLIRYRTGNIACLLSYKKVLQILIDCNCTHLEPSLKLPFGLICGRHKGLCP